MKQTHKKLLRSFIEAEFEVHRLKKSDFNETYFEKSIEEYGSRININCKAEVIQETQHKWLVNVTSDGLPAIFKITTVYGNGWGETIVEIVVTH